MDDPSFKSVWKIFLLQNCRTKEEEEVGLERHIKDFDDFIKRFFFFFDDFYSLFFSSHFGWRPYSSLSLSLSLSFFLCYTHLTFEMDLQLLPLKTFFWSNKVGLKNLLFASKKHDNRHLLIQKRILLIYWLDRNWMNSLGQKYSAGSSTFTWKSLVEAAKNSKT